MDPGAIEPGAPPASFRVGDWLADPARDVLVRDTEQVKIEPKSMAVLVQLARRAGDVVTQAELESQVWRGLVVTSQSVYQTIAQLRRVLGDHARTPQYIETVTRRGYRLVAPVTWIPAEDRGPASFVAPAPRWRRWPVAVAAVLGVAAIVLAGWRYWPDRLEARTVSVAVLSFDDLTADGSQAYLANLLVEELTSALGQVEKLKVAARDSARIAARDSVNATEIGKRLGVNHVLNGSVRRVGDRIRVVAVLVETDTAYEKWSRTFERPAASIARLPADIAGAVAGAVGLALVGDPGVRGSRVGTRNPTAYDYYMLGQQRFAERTTFALSEAQRYFQLAVETDPNFAAAYVALADVHVAEFYFANRQLSETLDLMLPLVDKALEIDPAFGPAQAMRGWAAVERGEFAQARVDLARALELSPNDAKARMWLGNALFADARPREALVELDRALELNPLSFITHIRRALVLDALGLNKEAVEAATRASTLAPKHPNPHWTLALIATSRGDLAQAIAHFEAALALDPTRSDLRIQLATLLLDSGQATPAREQLAEAARQAQSSHSYLTARAYEALLGNDRRELAAIAESLASIDPRNPYLVMDAANFMALADEHQHAIELFDRALAENRSARLNDLWMIRWGLETAPECLAWSYTAVGRIADRDELIAEFDHFLAGAQQSGVRYWGIPYQRAALAALSGDATRAMAHLEAAATAGWRRTWWARTDPALASLQGRPEFQLLLDRISVAPGARGTP
jgi:DNA-binding winged helix-turn-helix (wHTH) protein/TolB-like protein/tetratricopeptide (TPR) repeat protein